MSKPFWDVITFELLKPVRCIQILFGDSEPEAIILFESLVKPPRVALKLHLGVLNVPTRSV